MKQLTLFAILGVFALTNMTHAQDKKTTDKRPSTGALKSVKAQASYGIGLSIGGNMQRNGLGGDTIDLAALIKGLQDALADRKPAIGDKELDAAMTTFQKELTAKQAEKEKIATAKNIKEGEDYLAANKKKKGVKTLKSGLQYQVLKSGKGDSPKLADTVTTHYHGMLIDGTVFDSSVDRGEPSSFPVGGVIRGWTEALQLMKVGDKWRLVLPSNLAYGEQGAGGKIGPNAVLVFEVELISIKKAPESVNKKSPKKK